MKSFAQLIILAIASTAIVSAELFPQASIEPCASCVAPDCTTAQYPAHVEVKEEKLGSNNLGIRTFQTESRPGQPSNLVAAFKSEANVKMLPSSGVITNRFETALVLSIGVGSKSDPLLFKLEPTTVCSAPLPNGYSSKDVTKVEAFMKG